MTAEETKPTAPAMTKPAQPEPSVEDWHARHVARQTITVTQRKAANPHTGYRRPERKQEVTVPSARCVLSHRALHGLSPKERVALDAAFKGDEKAIIKHLDAHAPEELGELEPSRAPDGAMHPILAVHLAPSKLAEHRKRALAALDAPPKA